METTHCKTRDGHQMLTVIPLDVITACQRMSGDKGEPQLHITTSKHSRGLSTNASVMLKGDGSLSHVFFSDFSKTVCTSESRATEKSVRELHAKALASADAIVAQAIAHYAKP